MCHVQGRKPTEHLVLNGFVLNGGIYCMDNPAPREMNASDVQQHIRNIGGKAVVLDKASFLWHPEDWTEEIAIALAEEIGIKAMSMVQWRIVRFLREYFFANGRAPLNRDLKAGLGMTLMELECSFPGGIKHGARRVAGLPNPKTCSG